MDRIQKKATNTTLYYLKRCGAYFKPYTLRIICSLISMAVVGACTAYAAYLVQPALDKIFINKDVHALHYIPLLVIGLFALKGIFRIIQVMLMQSCGLLVLEKLRNDLYYKLLHLPVSFFEQMQVGMLMSRIINDVNLIRNSIPDFIMFFRQLVTMAGLLFVAFYRDAYLASWAILVLPLAFYPIIFFGRKLRKLGRKNQAKLADISVILQEIFSGIRVVKAFATENREVKKFKEQNHKLVKIALRGVFYNALSSPVMEFIGALGIGLVIWYGGTQVIAGKSTPGTFFSFLTALMMLYEPVKQISKSNMTIQKAIAGAERVFAVLDYADPPREEQGQLTLTSQLKDLSFKNIFFRYPGYEQWALQNVSFSVHPGERLAIVGPSGAGKSTIASLLPRFYNPTSGQITINGHPIAKYRLDNLRRFIGIVSQETFLFNASILENITYGLEGVSQQEVERVCKIAYAHDFISQLPEGYATIIGERGIKLSGGEKQRLTIARALLKNPPLLILDEATSALDTQSELIVQKALENLMQDRTSIIIAHRLSTVISAHRIMVLTAGKIIDIGTHDQLLKRCTLYRKLYQME